MPIHFMLSPIGFSREMPGKISLFTSYEGLVYVVSKPGDDTYFPAEIKFQTNVYMTYEDIHIPMTHFCAYSIFLPHTLSSVLPSPLCFVKLRGLVLHFICKTLILKSLYILHSMLYARKVKAYYLHGFRNKNVLDFFKRQCYNISL